MTHTRSDSRSKIRPEHLCRAAYVYIRQSSAFQVQHHLESQRRQYALVDWVAEVGWPKERIVVVDEDQGKSGACAQARTGFGRLITAVGRGEVGMVASLEASRLARNSPDWHNLLYLCRFTGTLIADEHAVYDPTESTDRMVLGLRGQMSELELDHSIHRMVEARWNKARRGEMMHTPSPGYEIDDLGQLVMTSDEAVANAIRTVFAKFDEIGSARQVWLWWKEQGLKFPVRRFSLRSHPIVWGEPSHRMILQTLHHPIYAGAYVFGRTQTVRQIDPDDLRQRVVRRVIQRKEWPVLIKDHHPGYIPFEKFVENQQRLADNATMRVSDSSGAGAVREGAALLQGLARCGACGRPMQVSYGGRRPGRGTLQYRCMRARQMAEGKDCQLVGGKRIDTSVVDAFLEATQPATIEASVLAEEQCREQSEALERTWRLQIEKAEYEAQRAERQYHAVEPENRTVARELERRWNERLVELESVRAEAHNALDRSRPLTEMELAKGRQLAADLEVVWNAETTTNRDRKRLLRCLIEEVQLRTEPKRYTVRIVWKGGTITDREVVRRPKGTAVHGTAEETLDLVRKLAREFDDTQIARILTKQGRRTGMGNPFTKLRVKTLRDNYDIPHCEKQPARDPREGPFTADQAAVELGVAMTTIHKWLRDGILAGQQATPGAPWRIVLSDEVRHRLCAGDAPKGWVGLTEAAKRLGLTKSHVAYLVKTAKLKAMRTTVGKRRCWRIDVLSADCGPQPDLFDQTTNDDREEA